MLLVAHKPKRKTRRRKIPTHFIDRHQQAHKKLVEAVKLKHRTGVQVNLSVVANRLGITSQSVTNYIAGSCKDGFLTEAIAEEIFKLE